MEEKSTAAASSEAITIPEAAVHKFTAGINFTTTITLIATFLTLSGGFWHLGYWTAFNFNYFEYANYTDLFKSSLYPFFSSTWLFIGMMTFALVYTYMVMTFAYWFTVKKSRKVRNSSFNNAELIILDILIAAAFIISGVFQVLTRPSYMWDILPFSLSVGLLSIVIRFQFLNGIIPNSDVILIIFSFLIIVPIFNFFNGKKISLDIKSGLNGNIITGFNSSDPILL